MRRVVFRSAVALLAFVALPVATQGASPCRRDKPRDFVFLKDIEPSIIEDLRYAGSDNFVGRPLAGYPANASCMLTRQAALALQRVQRTLQQAGLSLKVYDCYRPDRAVRDMMAWTRDASSTSTKVQYYPRVEKTALVRLGYLAARSAHSRGSTVDVVIAPLASPSAPAQIDRQHRKACTATDRAGDGTLDFGTSFDCFDDLSRTQAQAVGEEARRNRAYLVKEMVRAGLRNYTREWWHFELVGEPHASTCFDFPVERRAIP
jgi:D-alanyl-D-alanine dipeptidase